MAVVTPQAKIRQVAETDPPGWFVALIVLEIILSWVRRI